VTSSSCRERPALCLPTTQSLAMAASTASAHTCRDSLAAYVRALGGKLKIIADFGDESYILG
jgi:hypothetical protein